MRVVPDAVVGGGFNLRAGDVVSSDELGPYLGRFLEMEVIEPCVYPLEAESVIR